MSLDVLGMYLGGEGGIRTPDSLATMSDFESGAFNRALPPLRFGFERPGHQGLSIRIWRSEDGRGWRAGQTGTGDALWLAQARTH